MTELLSRSSTMPPATAPRGWHMRFPPWVKKKSLSQAVVTKPVLLGNRRDTGRIAIVVELLPAGYKNPSINWDHGTCVEGVIDSI